MENPYSRLLSPTVPVARENTTKYHFITERHIQVMWFEQKYFRDLQSTENEEIQVLSPGIWNNGPGPDFLKAHIIINGKAYRGDVEIHLSEESWKSHGHHENMEYDNVILHIVLWRPKNPVPICVKSGRVVTSAYLEPILTIPLSRISSLIDLDLYPYEQFAGSGKCAETLYRKLSKDQIEDLFQKAAFWRLANKKQYLKQHFDTDPECFLGGIALALGYKNNSQAFLQLFLKLNKYPTADSETLLVQAMGWCGFFREMYQSKWRHSSRYKKLHASYEEMGRPEEGIIHLKLSQIRPLNHPIRRLVYLIYLLGDPSKENLYANLANAWHREQKLLCSRGKLREKLYEVIPVYKDSYWNSHYLFEQEERKEFLSLAGDNFREEVLVNAFLPLLYGQLEARGDLQELLQFQEFFGSIPALTTSKTRYLHHRFFGNSSENFLEKAQAEQGAYQIHKDFCLHYEASCEGCPFVERYQKTFRLNLTLSHSSN
jgi:hypothetical protein